jgi:hypothetical protein
MDPSLLIPLIFIFNFIALTIGSRIMPPRFRGYMTPALVLLALLAIAPNVRGLPHGIDMSMQSVAGVTAPTLSLRFTLDSISILAFAVVLVGWGALVMLESQDRVGSRSEWLWLAAFFLLVTAGNMLTLIGAMLFNDLVALVYFARRESATTTRRYFVINQLSTLALLLAAILASASALDLNSDKLVLNDLAGFFALASIGIRLCLFPFHLALPFNYWIAPERPLWNIFTPSVMTLAVLARVSNWLPTEFANAQWLYAWILVSLMFSAIQAWREDNPKTAVIWLWQIFLALAFAVPVFVPSDLRIMALGANISAAFALVLIEAAERLLFSFRRVDFSKVLFAWAIGILAGVPFTSAFLGRLAVYSGAWNWGLGLLILLAAMAMAFGLMPLAARWWALGSRENRMPSRTEGIALGALVLFGLLTSFTPFSLLAWLDAQMGRSAWQMMTSLLVGPQIGLTVLVLVATAGSITFAFYTSARWELLRQQESVSFDRLLKPLMFDRGLSWVGRIAERFAHLMRMIYALIEHYPLGWVLFIALWVSVMVATSR